MSDLSADTGFVPLDASVRADQWEALQEIATRTGVERDDVVRRALDIGLAVIRHDGEETEQRPPTASQ